jgi:hypothetical protein
MTRRDLLHVADAEAFVAWALENGGFKLDPRAPSGYEIFRLRDKGGKIHVGYKRDRTDHVSIFGNTIEGAVRSYIHAKRIARLREQQA